MQARPSLSVYVVISMALVLSMILNVGINLYSVLYIRIIQQALYVHIRVSGMPSLSISHACICAPYHPHMHSPHQAPRTTTPAYHTRRHAPRHPHAHDARSSRNMHNPHTCNRRYSNHDTSNWRYSNHATGTIATMIRR